MNKGLTAASCVSHQRQSFLWISDGLLADTFARFCHQKRHGSNVPGPLEAQRRTSRRKNTSFAYTSQGAPAIDPALVFTRSQNIDWWHTPTDCELAKVPAPTPHLSAWLFPNRESFPDPSDTSHDGPSVPQLQCDTQDELSQCRDLFEVQEWMARQDVRLHDNTEVGNSIWKHILQTPFSAEEIAEYISDPSFHPPGTSYIAQLLPTLLSRTWGVRDWRLVRDSTARSVELGLIGLYDLKTILKTLYTSETISFRRTGGILVETKRETIYLTHDILQAIGRSKVLQLSELGTSFLSRLFSTLLKFDTPGLRSPLAPILWDLVPWGRANNAAMFSHFVVRHLRDCGRNAHEQASQSSTAVLLKKASPALLRMLLLHTTENLVKLARDQPTNTYKHLFRRWIDILASLGYAGENSQPTRSDWVIYRSHDRSLTQHQREMICAWTAFHLTQHTRRSPSIQAQLRGHHLFGKTIKSVLLDQGLKKVHFYGRAQSALGGLALPNKSVLLNELELVTSMPVAPRSNHSESQVEDSLPYDLSLVLEDRVYRHKRQRLRFNGALEELGECLNHDLTDFCSMSRRLIHKNDTSFDIITRLLDCNSPLKAALSTSIRQSQAGQQGSQKKGALTLTESERSQNMLDPAQALALVNHLAISFATAPVARPRRALRRVYWCYRFLHRYGAPIEPDITKALWHAGVTRIGEGGYGEFGTAKSFLKWILWQVNLVEGKDVAAQLLWSRSYRLERRAEMIALAGLPGHQCLTNGDMITEGVQHPPNQYECNPLSASRLDAGCLALLSSANTEHDPVLQDSSQEDNPETDTDTGLDHEAQHCNGGLLERVSTTDSDGVKEVDPSTTAITEKRMHDLMVLQRIRHVKLSDVLAQPFWYTKSERRMDWERRRLQTRTQAGSSSSAAPES
ncbi:uncharacterized protein PV06_03600 [Exophiala oligosperma]|uniref:Uncharacterized protein n=1 Tax=Exophiala oligosperma TaxID=215243 RepID=A0A0D2DQN5_9EURO|nr:uncharacterized protein PV06_03600 [Exophiala oligosperma]KIW45198.1 hypothetical protein PV06_03600 [Exophiala oligosperma]